MVNMKREEKLILNTIIFGIGNLGSKLILFFLVPIYTFYLSTREFGYVDLITTIVSLSIPIVSLCIYESILRFVLDKEYNIATVLNTGLIAMSISSFVILLIGILLNNFIHIKYLMIILVLLVLQMFNILLSQYVKGIQKNIVYSLNGIIIAFLTLLLTLIFFNLDLDNIKAYFLAQIIAFFAGSLFLLITGDVLQKINFSLFNLELLKQMAIYSIPLIPNQIMWWIMNVSDRFFITSIISLSANGLYAVASKIPSLLNLFSSVFMQAWQVSAIEELDRKNKDAYYSKVFNNLVSMLIIVISIILLVLKIIIALFISEEFSSVWKYVPALLISMFFSNLSMFIGTNYLVVKKTVGILKTSIYGAIINIFLNIVLIPMFGLNGASIATLFSFMIVLIIRVRETKKIVNIHINWLHHIFSFSILCLQIAVLYINKFELIFNTILFIILVLLNLRYILSWFELLILKVFRNRK